MHCYKGLCAVEIIGIHRGKRSTNDILCRQNSMNRSKGLCTLGRNGIPFGNISVVLDGIIDAHVCRKTASNGFSDMLNHILL